MELQIRDISKTYSNGVRALKGVTLTITAGIVMGSDQIGLLLNCLV